MPSTFSRSLVLILAALGLSACASRASIAPDRVAAADFSREHYCPVERVRAAPIATVPRPPERIARDPERVRMWTEAKLHQADAEPVAVAGCGEASKYKCWVEGGWEPTRHGRRYVNVLTACLEDSPPNER